MRRPLETIEQTAARLVRDKLDKGPCKCGIQERATEVTITSEAQIELSFPTSYVIGNKTRCTLAKLRCQTKCDRCGHENGFVLHTDVVALEKARKLVPA